ncbi:MAG: TIGR00730 family Rossman fold protein [Hyphomicrobiales bacterium]
MRNPESNAGTGSQSIKAVAVYCGSNTGLGEVYLRAATSLGQSLAQHGITLVYGGTHKGLMGALATAALSAGGQVHGVITQRLADKGHVHERLSELEVLSTMKERKARMIDVADAMIALPGGIGTLEEFMEAWTLNQLGEIDKPAGLLSVNGYYEPFMGFIDHMIEQRFLPSAHRNSIVVESESEALIIGLKNFEKVTVPKWM